MPESEDRWTRLAGGRVHSLAGRGAPPEGPAVVLVHGLVVASGYLRPTLEALAPLCRVHAPDLPGYGRSYRPDPPLDLAGLADALAAWMAATGLGRAHLLGNSFGCQVIVEFALRHPGLVDRIVLQGPTVDPAARTFWRQLGRWLVNSRREHTSLGRLMWADYVSAGPRRVWHTVRLALDDRIEEKLPAVAAPALVVRGSRDPLVPQDWAERVAGLLPRGRLCVVPGEAHTLVYVAPERLVVAVAGFLGLEPCREAGISPAEGRGLGGFSPCA